MIMANKLIRFQRHYIAFNFHSVFFSLSIKLTVLLSFSSNISAQDFIYLKNDSVLWTPSAKLHFAANSIAKLNAKHQVVFGFLNEERFLWTKYRLIKFKAGSEIQFDDEGNVRSGVLAENMNLRTPAGFVNFKAGRQVQFDDNGNVISGFLLRNTWLKNGENEILFKEGSYIQFDEQGNIIEGRLAQKHHLECTDGKARNFKNGEIIYFNKEHKVIYQEKKKNKGKPKENKPNKE